MVQQNKKIYFILILGLVILNCLLLTGFSQAEDKMPTLNDPLGNRPIPILIGGIINYILGVVGVLALVMFIYGGITWMTSGGSADKIKKGKDTIIWAVLGLAFIFFSYAILDFILRALLDK